MDGPGSDIARNTSCWWGLTEGTEGDGHIKRVFRFILAILTQIELPTVRAITSPMAQTDLLACARIAR